MSRRPEPFVVPPARAGEKLVDVVKRHLIVLPVPAVGPLLEAGQLSLDGAPIVGSRAINQRVHPGQTLELREGGLEHVAHRLLTPHDGALHIVHQDVELVVVDKPAGWNVHPLGPHRDQTLVGRLAWIAGARPAEQLDHWRPWGAWRGHPLHRLDRPTTGLLVFTTSADLHTTMREQLEKRTMRRGYQALVHGVVRGDSGTVEAPIGPDPTSPKDMAIVPVAEGGRSATTHWRVVERRTDATVVDLDLETGRTHQIRVHLASLGHPIVGDVAYGGRLPDQRSPWWHEGRIGLHASRLTLGHPTSGDVMHLASPAPW